MPINWKQLRGGGQKDRFYEKSDVRGKNEEKIFSFMV